MLGISETLQLIRLDIRNSENHVYIRDAYATNSLEAGIGLRKIKEIIGDSSQKMTCSIRRRVKAAWMFHIPLEDMEI